MGKRQSIPRLRCYQESLSALPIIFWSILVFYLKILIGHPWNQGWGGFSSAKATSEVAQEVGQGERESNYLNQEQIECFFDVLIEEKILTTNTSHFNLREKIAVKKKRIQKAGAATRPVQNIDTYQYFLSQRSKGKKKTPRLLKACAGPPLLCSQRPRWTHPRRWCSSTTWFAICSQVLSWILAEDLSPARMRPLTFLTVQKSSERRRMMRTKLPMKLSENQPQRR